MNLKCVQVIFQHKHFVRDSVELGVDIYCNSEVEVSAISFTHIVLNNFRMLEAITLAICNIDAYSCTIYLPEDYPGEDIVPRIHKIMNFHMNLVNEYAKINKYPMTTDGANAIRDAIVQNGYKLP